METRRFLPVLIVLFLSAPTVSLANAAPPVLDESPAQPGEWGFRPDSGESPVKRNPPPMSWRPVEGAASYVVEVARDSAFDDVVYQSDSLKWSSHCPSIAFDRGTYFWRYAVMGVDGGQSAWSVHRSFRVGLESVMLPRPNVSTLVARAPSTHPRLFLRPNDVPGLRLRADTDLKSAWGDVKKRADKLLKTPPNFSEPPLYPPGTVRKSGEWKEIWWGNRKRAIAVADGAATLAFAYVITGDERYGEGARDALIALTKWDPEGSTQYRYNDEAAMPLLYMPSRAYSWAYPILSDADRQAVVKMMRVRGAQCFDHLRGRNHLWRPYASHSNRAWHFLGEVATAFLGEIPEAEMWLDYAMTVMYTAYPVWGDADGGWHEGTAYWASYLSRYMYWAFVADAAYGINAFDFPYFANAGYYGMYALPPGTKAGGFGDQAGHIGDSRIGPLMRLFAAGSGNPHWAWYADQLGAGYGSGYLGFLYAANAKEVTPEAPTGLPTSRVFYGTGLAILNTNLEDASKNIQIHFKSSPMGRQSHGYNANNAFLLNVGGQQVLLDSGRRDVSGSPHHREWMHHSKSDNAILVNGEGQIMHTAGAMGQIVRFESSSDAVVVAGDAADSYKNLDRWRRVMELEQPKTIIVHDYLTAPKPSTFRLTFHARGPFEITEDGATWEGPTCSIRMRFEGITENNPIKISQTDAFDPPPAEWSGFELNEWHLTVTKPAKRRKQQFVTRIDVEMRESVNAN
jgi:hypothetical protein